jgi:hypothetical protein
MSAKNLTLSKDLPYDLKIKSLAVGSQNSINRLESSTFNSTVSAQGGSLLDITDAVVNYADYTLIGNVCKVNLEVDIPNGTSGALSIGSSIGLRVTLPFNAEMVSKSAGTVTVSNSGAFPTNPAYGVGYVVVSVDIVEFIVFSIITSAGASASPHTLCASFSYTIA